jgi:hypothetical protein
MLVNTLQVRAIAKQCKAKAAHTYTDKTSAQNPKRRSVVYMFYSASDANAMQKHLQKAFKQQSITNTVKRTGTVRNYATRCFGAQYVRVIADVA